MKKNYMTPECVNIQLLSSPVMMVVSGEQGGTNIGGGTAGNETPDLSAGKREDWGNLWK